MMQNPTVNQYPTDQAVALFRQTALRGWFHRLWAWLTHRTPRLLNLDETLCCTDVENSHYKGVQTISIDSIRGTEGKADAFDEKFHPIQEASRGRWLSIAREKLRGHNLPPVELVDVDGIYYVRDGHHRISVARSLG
jgi:hypothetical protein